MISVKNFIQFNLAMALCALVAFPASAQCPVDQAVFIFDQSGSMEETGSTGEAKWQIGRAKALNDFASLPSDTEVAIMAFGNTPVGSTPYAEILVSLADGLVKGTDDTALTTALIDASVPDSSYWTPVAGSVCDALEMVFLFDPLCAFETSRNVYLYTDGLENSTPTWHDCYSSFSSTTPFDVELEDEGFGLEPGSWEWLVANMAWTGNPYIMETPVPGAPRPVVSVSLLFDWINVVGASGGSDGALINGAGLKALTSNATAFYSGLATITHGTYFEAKRIGDTPTVIPVPGDTNPEPLYSCVDSVDLQRVLEVYGRVVSDGDQNFSVDELALRDVNNDLVIDTLDYYLVLQYYGQGCQR